MFMSFISAFKAGHWIIFMPLEGGFYFLFFNTMLWICDVAVAKGEERVEGIFGMFGFRVQWGKTWMHRDFDDSGQIVAEVE